MTIATKNRIRPKEEREQCKNAFFQWILLNRNRKIPISECERKLNETIKDKSILYTMRKIGYLDIEKNIVTVHSHFANDDILRERIKQYKRVNAKNRKKKSEKVATLFDPASRLPSSTDTTLLEIKTMLEKIMKDLNIN